MRKYKSLMATIMEDIYPIHEKYQYFSESVEHIGEMVGKDVKVKLRRKGHEYTPENTYTNIRGHRRCRLCWAERNKNNATRD